MNLTYFKNIIPAAALVAAVGLSSCTKDLDVTPIDPSKTMVPDEAALFTKCYAQMALQGQTGANGDCDIDGLDGGTAGFVRQLFNANELTTDEAICAWVTQVFLHSTLISGMHLIQCCKDSIIVCIQVLLIATIIWMFVQMRTLPMWPKYVSFVHSSIIT
jgi:hypothetical protein